MEIQFELKLPLGPSNSFVIVAGGADGDGDGTIEKDTEVAALTRAGNVWSRKQQVNAPTAGMLFALIFTVGIGVGWSLEIKDAAGRILHASNGTTPLSSEVVSGRLS